MSLILRLGLATNSAMEQRRKETHQSIPNNHKDLKFEMLISVRRITMSAAYQVGHA